MSILVSPLYNQQYNYDLGKPAPWRQIVYGFATTFQVQDMETPPNWLNYFSNNFVTQ